MGICKKIRARLGVFCMLVETRECFDFSLTLGAEVAVVIHELVGEIWREHDVLNLSFINARVTPARLQVAEHRRKFLEGTVAVSAVAGNVPGLVRFLVLYGITDGLAPTLPLWMPVSSKFKGEKKKRTYHTQIVFVTNSFPTIVAPINCLHAMMLRLRSSGREMRAGWWSV